MDNEVNHTADFYRLVAWAHARRKQLMWISGTVVAVAAIVGIYFWHKNANETAAAEAYSNLKPVFAAETTQASAADPYLKLANDYSGTAAGARAVLTAGGILFDAGKFKDAETQFERFLADYSESSLAGQAVLGVAATLEAQGKLAEATSRYEDLVHRHATDSTAQQAKSALARLYVAQNKPDKAFEIYTDLAQGNNSDSWSAEAGIQAAELLQKFPNLRKPAPMTMPTGSSSAPPLNLPKK